jgi:hypothetical protein
MLGPSVSRLWIHARLALQDGGCTDVRAWVSKDQVTDGQGY